MNISIRNKDFFNIKDNDSLQIYFGGDQAWYIKAWSKEAGCGPTCAANITAYLARSKEMYKELYPSVSSDKNEFSKHMEVLFQYVTPGAMGVNSVTKFTDGLEQYLKAKNITLTPKILSVDPFSKKLRDTEELKVFVEKGLLADCPIAFLNLSKGAERRLQGWHWITITGVRTEGESLIAEASDEGKKIEFDLKLWYMTTKMHGGLIYYV
ncbi:hypothetical protein acsn021_20870 [Anaerocolumna cellulosilytica]|uniref:Uncharacterized protein n=1 Tax=Anaerocolumna cellulosilytica TaxID=433286 RepID=A0A6S6R672_9FIRM|nr:hypothetical protein [Anaerocolumna cellulosilytica]MBB5194269.1 hypothetical protein [Anaerocolumna cellulosilytica]BCJ94518.1 hypothetical protein acsn021_20870 [Anaerocolumna cellulosilytica]